VIIQIRHMKFKELLIEDGEKIKKNLYYHGSVITLHLSDLVEILFQDKVTKCH